MGLIPCAHPREQLSSLLLFLSQGTVGPHSAPHPQSSDFETSVASMDRGQLGPEEEQQRWVQGRCS